MLNNFDRNEKIGHWISDGVEEIKKVTKELRELFLTYVVGAKIVTEDESKVVQQADYLAGEHKHNRIIREKFASRTLEWSEFNVIIKCRGSGLVICFISQVLLLLSNDSSFTNRISWGCLSCHFSW